MFNKIIFQLVAFIIFASATSTQAERKLIHCSLKIEKIRELKGHLKITLYNSAETYNALDGNRAYKNFIIRVDAKEQLVDLGDLPSGDYWINFYHDANDNNKFDLNFMGIPKEGYGFSNNGGQFGPPSAENALIHLEKDNEIVIHER